MTPPSDSDSGRPQMVPGPLDASGSSRSAAAEGCDPPAAETATKPKPGVNHGDVRLFLSQLAPANRLTLHHLLTCPRCQHEAERQVVDDVRDRLTPAARPPAVRFAGGQAAPALPRARDAASMAPRSAAPLAGAPGEASAADPPLEDPQAAVRLLALADEALDQPLRAEQLGAAAFAIVSSHDFDLLGRNMALLLRALWVILRSRRVQRRLAEAEETVHQATPFLGALPGVTEDRALLLGGVAQLRWSERRLDEAAALFSQAGRVCGEFGASQGQAAYRAQAGFVLVEIDDPRRARDELTLAHAHIDARLAPALAARIALILAWCCLATGRAEAAAERLSAARALYQQASSAGEGLLRRWWEARIAAFDGRTAEADADLDAVRRDLLAAGSVPEAARCTLDLLTLRIEAERLESLSQLGPDLLDAFACRVSAVRPAELIDWLATLAANRSARLPSALAAIRCHLVGLRPSARDAFVGQSSFAQDRPDLIADAQDLADALLVAARRAGAAGA